MPRAEIIPGLHPDHSWAIPDRLNMARQCLSQPSEQIAILDLSEDTARPVTFGELSGMVDRIARGLLERVQPGGQGGGTAQSISMVRCGTSGDLENRCDLGAIVQAVQTGCTGVPSRRCRGRVCPD